MLLTIEDGVADHIPSVEQGLQVLPSQPINPGNQVSLSTPELRMPNCSTELQSASPSLEYDPSTSPSSISSLPPLTLISQTVVATSDQLINYRVTLRICLTIPKSLPIMP